MNLSRPVRLCGFQFVALLTSLVLLLVVAVLRTGWAHPNDFNKYVLGTVDMLATNYGGKGYEKNGAFTHDLKFGDNGEFKAVLPPFTMCVAAQFEVIIEALNQFYKEKVSTFPFHFMPRVYWSRLRPHDFRGEVWIVDYSPSHGAADAFVNFGMGERVPFRDLNPGDFLNFNRSNKTGHAVVFLGYIDKEGHILSKYEDSRVAGFKYFSSQGQGHPDGGLGYRWAFFEDAGCPALDDSRKRDCAILRTENNNYLVGGFLRVPTAWDQKKAADYILQGNSIQDPRLLEEGTFNANFFTGVTTDD
jgi:hypothetical protein